MRFGNSPGRFLLVYGHDDVSILVGAEYLRSGSVEPVERLGGGMAVGVVGADLDHGYLRREAV